MMPFVAALIAAIVSSALLRLMLKDTLPSRKKSFVFAGLLLISIGLFVGVFASNKLTSGLAQKEWPMIQGVVISSTITGERAYAPLVVYQYTVGGETNEGESRLRVPMFGGKRKKMEVASKSIAEYLPGDTVMVSYNLTDRSKSSLTPGPVWSDYGQLGASWFVLMIGLLLMLLPPYRLESVR